MFKAFSFNCLHKFHINIHPCTFYKRLALLGNRSLWNSKNTLNYRTFLSYRNIKSNTGIVTPKTQHNVPYRRYNHQDNRTNPGLTKESEPTSTNGPPNGERNGNRLKQEADYTRKQRAIRRIKTRFQNFKSKLNKNKRVQNLKLYLDQNKRLQNFKLYLNKSARFQRFRSYLLQKRQNLKGFTNKVNRREKLKDLKDKFMHKSLAFRLSALLTLKRYGKIGAVIYLSVYIVTLACMNAIVFMDYLTSDDVRKALNYMNITSLKVPDVDSPFAKVVVAYIATKLVEPLRLVVSILLTIAITKVLRR